MEIPFLSPQGAVIDPVVGIEISGPYLKKLNLGIISRLMDSFMDPMISIILSSLITLVKSMLMEKKILFLLPSF